MSCVHPYLDRRLTAPRHRGVPKGRACSVLFPTVSPIPRTGLGTRCLINTASHEAKMLDCWKHPIPAPRTLILDWLPPATGTHAACLQAPPWPVRTPVRTVLGRLCYAIVTEHLETTSAGGRQADCVHVCTWRYDLSHTAPLPARPSGCRRPQPADCAGTS